MKRIGVLSALLLAAVVSSDVAFALGGGADVNAVAKNIETSASSLPGLVSVFAYIAGLILGISGVLKLRDHVEAPQQTKLQSAVVRLVVGGMMFALPILYEAAANTIGNQAFAVDPGNIVTSVSSIFGNLGILSLGVNNVLQNIVDSTSDIPGVITIVAYLIGLVLVVAGALKIRDHVDNPEQVSLKEPVIRLLAGGALLALPTVYNAMFSLSDTGGTIGGFLTALGFVRSGYSGGLLGGLCPLIGTTAGSSVCNAITSSAAIPAFLTVVAYILGLIFGVWGILKIRDHVLNPQQTGLSEGVTRLVAGGFFFGLPMIVEAVRVTIAPTILSGAAAVPITNYNETAPGGGCQIAATATNGPGLDGLVYCMMADMMAPLHLALNFFAFVAGTILIMIGISRLIKSAQEGARGPGGLGTIMTFVVGGALISYNELVRGASATFFGTSGVQTSTNATLQYTKGMAGAEVQAAHTVISSILKFVIVVGLISFVRGLFIIRSVAEGNQQASIMAGVTHVIAGALAVNLGPLINAVQATLGIGAFGIQFN